MNKVKPFCIKYEDWMTDEQVQDVLCKAVAAGAQAEECVQGVGGNGAGFIDPHYLPSDFEYFGVNDEGQTWFSNAKTTYANNIIKLDEVDKHLTSADNVDVDALVLKIEALGYEVNLTKKTLSQHQDKLGFAMEA